MALLPEPVRLSSSFSFFLLLFPREEGDETLLQMKTFGNSKRFLIYASEMSKRGLSSNAEISPFFTEA